MEKELAEYIYMVMNDNNLDDEEYILIQKEREKIRDRYRELKLEYSFRSSERIAKIEWLMNCDKK